MKILCLGNNTEDSDHQARRLSQDEGHQYHGLISDLDRVWTDADIDCQGVYHSTPVDCSYQRLLELADQFDEIVVLDQPRESFDHPDSLMQIYRLTRDTKTPCRYNKVLASIDYWQNLLDTNPSFCVLPWVEYMKGDAADGSAVKLCCRSDIRIDDDQHYDDWQSDQRFVPIRDAMLSGSEIPHCEHCYKQERNGLTSDRRTETLEWVNRLALTSLGDLQKLHAPAYVEIRSSNRCNLMCRMCRPNDSHRIANEYKKIGLIQDAPVSTHVDIFSDVDPNQLKKIYVSGGEPLLNNDFFQWLERCSRDDATNIECLINTNGTKLPMRLKKHLPNWPNMQFIFSIDSYAEHNDYIRWPSRWHSIVENWHYLRDAQHRVHVNTTVSIYNVHRLSSLYRFIDSIYPDTLLHVNLVHTPVYLTPTVFPDRELVKQDIDQAMRCRCVQNSKLALETLKFIRDNLSIPASDSVLEKFFYFNDLLDNSRGSKLAQVDPILDSYRK